MRTANRLMLALALAALVGGTTGCHSPTFPPMPEEEPDDNPHDPGEEGEETGFLLTDVQVHFA